MLIKINLEPRYKEIKNMTGLFPMSLVVHVFTWRAISFVRLQYGVPCTVTLMEKKIDQVVKLSPIYAQDVM